MSDDDLKKLIRDIPDFPVKGIIFKDITPLLQDAAALKRTCDTIADRFAGKGITAVCGMEARGFIFGAVIAYRLGVGFIPLRKPGKLPYDTKTISYQLEYGTATLEIHKDGVAHGDRILMVDDVLATGGTMAASCKLIESLGAHVAACAFVIELGFLKGREKLAGYEVSALIKY